MITLHLRSYGTLLASALAAAAIAQCTNNNTVITGGAITPTCPGSTNVSCVQGGRYALVNVVAGNTYTFSTCGASWDTQITLYNNAGGGSLGYNDDACGLQSSVTWTANFTGQLRVLVDRYNCQNHNVCAPLNIQCATPPGPNQCVYVLTMNDSWGDGWGSSYVSVSINGGAWQNHTVSGTTNTVTFTVTIGQTFALNYNASGPWQGENSYSLTMQGAGALFVSGTPPQAGLVYLQTVDCVPPPAPPQDCVGGMTICSGQSFNNNSTHTGAVVDLNSSNQGCLSSGERQGTWYYFSPSSSGTIGFTIAPTAAIDYDFALWGPMSSVTCPPPGPPLRCSYASHTSTYSQTGSYNTGLGNGAIDVSEAPAGNGWVAPINVVAGQIYVLFIDNFSSTGQSFALDWQLSNGASLDCTVLPLDIVSFEAVVQGEEVLLNWSAVQDQDAGHFEILRSGADVELRPISIVPAEAGAHVLQEYMLVDERPIAGMNIYRLDMLLEDGTRIHGPLRSVMVGPTPTVHPNPAREQITVVHQFNADDMVMLLLRDPYGRKVVQKQHAVVPGTNSMEIPIRHLSSGLYFLELMPVGGQRIFSAPVLKE